MRRTAILATVISAVAVTGPSHATSRAVLPVDRPTVAVIEGHLEYDCFGCGDTMARFVGTVVQGAGLLPSDAAVSIDATVDVPPATCPAAETLSGSMVVDGNPYADIVWSRSGGAATVHLSNGGTGTAASEAAAAQCGSTVRVMTTVNLTAPGDDPEGSAVMPTGVCLVEPQPSDTSEGAGRCAGGLAGVVADVLHSEIKIGEDVLRRLLRTSHRLYTIGIGYSGRALNGNEKLLFVTTNASGCSRGAAFRFDGIASGWDNRIRSGRMGNGCRAFFYENQYLTGNNRQCVDVCRYINEGVSSAYFLR